MKTLLDVLFAICSLIFLFLLAILFFFLFNETIAVVCITIASVGLFPCLFWLYEKRYYTKKLQVFINKNYEKINRLYHMGTYTDIDAVFHGDVFIENFSALIDQELNLITVPNWEKTIIIRNAVSLYKDRLIQNSNQNEKQYIKSILSSVKYLNDLKALIYQLMFECFKIHEKTLYGKYVQMTYTDDYGNVVYDTFLKELGYFYDRVLLDNLMQNTDFAEMSEMEPIVLVGCDSIDNQTIKFSNFTYDDIENWCREKIVFKCNGEIIDLTEEYLASIKTLNSNSYLILEDVITSSNGHNLDFKKSIRELSLLENDENYEETLKSLKYCAVNFSTLFNRDSIIALCLLFTELYAKKQGFDKNNKVKDYTTTPYEFEKICADILEEQGFETKVTKKSGDQGVDVIAQKDGKVIAIQCKLYNQPVGNKAVQEVSAGKTYYKADYAVVVSTNTYTTSAKQLAQNCGVYLLNTEELKRLDEIINE